MGLLTIISDCMHLTPHRTIHTSKAAVATRPSPFTTTVPIDSPCAAGSSTMRTCSARPPQAPLNTSATPCPCVPVISLACSLAGTTGVDWVMHPSTAFVLLRFGSCYDNGNNADFGQYAFPSVRVVCTTTDALLPSWRGRFSPSLLTRARTSSARSRACALSVRSRSQCPSAAVPTRGIVSPRTTVLASHSTTTRRWRCLGRFAGIDLSLPLLTHPQELVVRFCFVYSDSGDNSGLTYFRLRRYNDGYVYCWCHMHNLLRDLSLCIRAKQLWQHLEWQRSGPQRLLRLDVCQRVLLRLRVCLSSLPHGC